MTLSVAPSDAQIYTETQRRRTFAIISHPDAGKTTLTEKLLLYAGAVDHAGSVRTRKNQRHATSDWMALERERGISITSTVLQFNYQDYCFNLLDTPGHQDFSEDTYRTLMAVDSAIMVLDSAKGIEAQTEKLFQVCRQRHIPLLTFINKLDNEGREPLALLDEIEQTLGMQVCPMNWPLGQGTTFRGVYDLRTQQIWWFERTVHGQHRAPVTMGRLDDPQVRDALDTATWNQVRDEIALITEVSAQFDRTAFLAGTQTPIFFGSALTNFGVEPFFQALIELAPAPRPRALTDGVLNPEAPNFSGFIFKMQANMDPLHRDRMAFMRVCSGRFEKDMTVYHPRLRRSVRISRPHRLFARDRTTIDEAYPGDVVGLNNPGLFTIGDTLCTGTPVMFPPMPPFHPERFAIMYNQTPAKQKQFQKGLTQLNEEGVMQILYAEDAMRREPILAAVGELQFDVVVARLAGEYGVTVTLDHLPQGSARWIVGEPAAVAKVALPPRSRMLRDMEGLLVVLFESPWAAAYCQRTHPAVRLCLRHELESAQLV
ncbi:MAG: peptide chain release factor 3 [Herpetosiphonaceae bacterium]|nr:peptide chain release factor 3 [Herpetosiphonaceae bacterium]